MTGAPATRERSRAGSESWVVVPMLDEASVVGPVVRGLRAQGLHVVCVDDASTDSSSAQALAAGAVVVRHPINLGQGAALQTGIAYALQDPKMGHVVTFDSDGQHDPHDVPPMLTLARESGADAVLGSRFLSGSTDLGLTRRLVLKSAVRYTNAVTGAGVTDAHNGLRVLGRAVCERLRIRQNRMAHATEIVAELVAGGFTIVEHPVHVSYSGYSRSKGQPLLNAVNIMAELLYRG